MSLCNRSNAKQGNSRRIMFLHLFNTLLQIHELTRKPKLWEAIRCLILPVNKVLAYTRSREYNESSVMVRTVTLVLAGKKTINANPSGWTGRSERKYFLAVTKVVMPVFKLEVASVIQFSTDIYKISFQVDTRKKSTIGYQPE